jgi:hypothetical protein
MAAQETYRIHETISTVLREGQGSAPHKDLATVRDQADRLLDLMYKDAARGMRYDLIKVKRYVLYLTPRHLTDAVDGRRIAEFSRLDDAEMARDALNATISPRIDDLVRDVCKHTEQQRLMNELNAKRDYGQPQI